MILLNPQLSAFIAVAKLGTVHAAASSINLTQTAVTQRIKGLENQLKVSLFERSRKGMRLTAEGVTLLRYCQKILEIEGETLALFDSNEDGAAAIQRLAISGPSSLLRSRIIPEMLGINTDFPNLRLSFEIDDNPEVSMNKLRAGSVQLAVLPRDMVAKEMDSKAMKPEVYFLAVPRAWKKRTLKDVVENEILIDFGEGDEMSLNYLKMLGLRESYRGERHFVNNTDALAAMIAKGMGYSVLSEEFAEPLLRKGEIASLSSPRAKPYAFEFALVWYKRPDLAKYFKAVVQRIK